MESGGRASSCSLQAIRCQTNGGGEAIRRSGSKGRSAHELLGVWDGAYEDAAGPEPSGDVLEHDAGLGLALEGVVHAELHGDDIEGCLEEIEREGVGKDVGITVEGEEVGDEARAAGGGVALLGLVNRDGSDIYGRMYVSETKPGGKEKEERRT